jgi:hypothetical protein
LSEDQAGGREQEKREKNLAGHVEREK